MKVKGGVYHVQQTGNDELESPINVLRDRTKFATLRNMKLWLVITFLLDQFTSLMVKNSDLGLKDLTFRMIFMVRHIFMVHSCHNLHN